MARGINKTIHVGRLGQDPQVRYSQDGAAIANFSIAINEDWKDKQGQKQSRTEWVNCVAFGRIGEIVGEYLRKSSLVYVEGQLRTSSWEQDGQKRYKTEIHVRELQMLDGKQDGRQRQQSAPQQSQQQPVDDDFDSDIPF